MKISKYDVAHQVLKFSVICENLRLAVHANFSVLLQTINVWKFCFQITKFVRRWHYLYNNISLALDLW